MAMLSAVLLASENKKLRMENQRQKRKRATRRTYIARGVFYREQKDYLVHKLPKREQQRQRSSDRNEHCASAACENQQNIQLVRALDVR